MRAGRRREKIHGVFQEKTGKEISIQYREFCCLQRL